MTYYYYDQLSAKLTTYPHPFHVGNSHHQVNHQGWTKPNVNLLDFTTKKPEQRMLKELATQKLYVMTEASNYYIHQLKIHKSCFDVVTGSILQLCAATG